MTRKCRQCKAPLPAMKDCKTFYQEHGVCGQDCLIAENKQKRAEYAERQRQREQARPRTARVSAKPKKRKPRIGDDGAYLKWVRTLSCCLCGNPADDAHHIITGGYGGMGMTAPDLFTMPVCRPCHRRIHAEPELWEHQPEWVLRTQAKAIQEGIL